MIEDTKTIVDKTVEDEIVVIKSDRYYEAVGRRKTATARARIFTKGTGIVVNGKDLKKYFVSPVLSDLIEAPLKKMKSLEKFKISIKVEGGGIRGQAEAVRHAISRALVVFNADFKKRLKRSGFLTRDPRAVERKKYGLKKARKSPRWSKR
ncbi:MAG: 30S ribosomal protein S9 [Patescibacteria group bacterium]